jgi:hypothetical protein
MVWPRDFMKPYFYELKRGGCRYRSEVHVLSTPSFVHLCFLRPRSGRRRCLGSAISQKISFGSSLTHADIGRESFGIVVCRFVGTVSDILGLVWPRVRLNAGSNSEISGRIPQRCRGPFSSAEESPPPKRPHVDGAAPTATPAASIAAPVLPARLAQRFLARAA